MNKKKLHHILTLIRRLSYVWLLGLGLFFAVVALFALRHNNQTMIGLKQAVFTADEKDGDVEGALKNLRVYVYSHMNTNLASGPNAVRPPIQLKYRYERLVAAEKARVADPGALYTDAQKDCERRIPAGLSGSNRLVCIQQYIDSHPASAPAAIRDDLYKFDFVSPSWSPDLAGWSMVAMAGCFVLFFIRYISEWLIRTELHKNS